MSSPLGKERRISRSGEYRRIYDSGVKVVGRYLVCFATCLDGAQTRVGITVSGKLGNACDRNRIKRRLRVAIPQVLDMVDPGALMVFVATRRIKTATFTEILADVKTVLTRVKGPHIKKT
jgi:ribonuclease P protein component